MTRSLSLRCLFDCTAAALVCAVVAARSGLAEEMGDAAAPPPADAAAVQFFKEQVQPILSKRCWKCHGAEAKIKGGLRLTGRAGVLKGGDTGPAIVPGKPGESLLIEAINYTGYEMPPTGKLPQAEIDILTRWVELGGPWSPGEADADRPAAAESPSATAKASKDFWAFKLPARPPLPPVQDRQWPSHPIDAFVLARLEQENLQPAPQAAPEVLLRRAYYDLIGLPPTPDEVQAFLADRSPNAFEKVVDRLLASPHYGERWARHWLDLVRYAETNSYERDGPKPFVWRYRDYVIRSFNDDKPFDRFVTEQLAGDELPEVTPQGIIATGYYRLGIWDDEPSDPVQALYDDLDDIVSTTSQVFLGMTVGCARCHDHKLDPIAQKDYYRMLAFFRNIRRYGVRAHETVLDASVRTIDTEEERRRHKQRVAAHQREMKETLDQLAEIERSIEADLSGVERDEMKNEQARVEIVRKRVPQLVSAEAFDNYVRLTEQRDRLREAKPEGLAQALCVKEHGREPPETHLLVRGNPHVPGAKVEPGFPAVLATADPQIVPPAGEVKSSGRRRVLAEWITSAENPLTARVFANRVWQYHFGRGIVRSPNNFGFHGTPPTHPRLLDWLASQLVQSGWRLKPLHKQIMMSSTYQMSSRADPKALTADPENDLLWRFDMRRLSAEEIRDSILAVSGNLNRATMFGPSVYAPIAAEVLAGQSRPGSGWGEPSPADSSRRSIYIHVKRSLVVPILASFDAADTDATCPLRFATTQPTQALGMLNGALANRQAAQFAGDLTRKVGPDRPQQVTMALRRVLQREPDAAEIERGLQLLEELVEQHQLSVEESLQRFCLVALNLNEFVYLD